MTAASRSLAGTIGKIPGMRDWGRHIEEQSALHVLSDRFFVLRNRLSLSVDEVASKMQVKRRVVEAIENSPDEQMRINDLAKYLSAMGYHITISVHSGKVSDKIKNHCEQVGKLLMELSELCEDDDTMRSEATRFMDEVQRDLIGKVERAASRLEPSQLISERPMEISMSDLPEKVVA